MQNPFKERGHRNKTHDTLWPKFQSKNEEPWESAEYAKGMFKIHNTIIDFAVSFNKGIGYI